MTASPAMPAFDADTALEPIGENRWRGAVSESWFVTNGPNGGFFAALATRALGSVTAAPPRSLTLHYLEAPQAGPVEISCTVERAGRTTTFCRLVIEQHGRPMALGLAACATWRDDQPEWLDAAPPEVPAPDTLPRFRGHGAPPFLAKYDVRLVAPQPEERPVSVTAWLRSADPRPADHALIAAMTDALFPPAFVRLSRRVFVPTIDLTIHWRAPVPGGEHPWVLGTFTSRMSAGGVCEEDGELWSDGGVLLAHSRQLAIVRRPR